MGELSMRGSRLGSHSLESEMAVELFPRVAVNYRCATNHEFKIQLAIDAEVPTSWICPKCSGVSNLVTGNKKAVREATDLPKPKSHYQMLMERRTKSELEELLKERLAYVKARRKSGMVAL